MLPQIRSASRPATLILSCNSLHSGLAELGRDGSHMFGSCLLWSRFSNLQRQGFIASYLISSSLAKIMTTLAFGFSRSRRMTLSNSPCLGSRGILTDWEMHTPPKHKKITDIYIKTVGQDLLQNLTYCRVN